MTRPGWRKPFRHEAAQDWEGTRSSSPSYLMVPIGPDSPEDAAAYDQPRARHRRKPSSLDIPKIRFLSWLGLESVIWGIVIGHLVKWAGNWMYYITWQYRYSVGPAAGSVNYVVWDGKDFWDRLPVHIQNGLPGEVAVLAGLAVAAAWTFLLVRLAGRRPWRTVLAVLASLLIGTACGLLAARQLAGWHVHWFPGQKAPQWWVTDRHDIRDVGISLFATIAVRLIFAKPKHAADDVVPVRVYFTSLPKALGAAMVPIAVIAVLAWKIPWLLQHGWDVPARFGALASEVNGWIAAGTWITVVMGIAGGLAAVRFIQRVADDIQWFFAERSKAKISSTSGLNALRGNRVYGTPSHRRRVRWLQEHETEAKALPSRNPWLVRGLLAFAFVVVIFAGAGAWLTLAGPAAVH